MKKLINYTFVVFLLLMHNHSFGQLMANRGQLIYSEDNSMIKVEGSFLNDTTSIINHNGLIVIDSSFIQNNGALTQGFGEYQVNENWNNSGSFIHDTSLVILTGGLQNIMGDSITDFYNLTLQGFGIKRQHVDAEVSNILDLRNNELATDSFTMFVSNLNGNAILYDNTYTLEGFVSSLDSGRLKRATNSNGSYIYPLGSSLNQRRFRPIAISPTNSNINHYAARLVNNDATNDGLTLILNDSSMCDLNNLFYHNVENTLGGDSADLTIFYDLSQDNYWDGQAEWNNILWANNSPNNLTSLNNYSGVNMINHQFNFSPIILITLKPETPIILGDSVVCSNNSTGFYSIVNVPGNNYMWTVSGGTIVNGQGTSGINVNWTNSSGGTVSVTATNPNSNCASEIGTFSTNFYPQPIAGISVNGSNFYSGDIIILNDASTGASSWNWDFNNGNYSSSQNTQTTYNNNGSYIIQLIVSNQFGCFDTTEITVNIGGEIIIPNVFTPNGDGSNDNFIIKGFEGNYDLVIINRWGQTLYEGNETTAAWDGTTLSGEETPEGTYFYIFSGENDFLKKGTLTLFR